ncbi:MAG: carboxypeptidase-like regulatory domain-containing protein, partial [archaeon]
MGDILKGFYYACEDKWYAGLDFLDKHGIPVYKVIDPIDQRIPSFALFSILVLLGLIFLVLPFGLLFQGSDVKVIFEVVDEESSPLPNIPVAFTYLNVQDKVITTNPLGRIELTVPSGTTIKYAVDTEKYEIIKKSVTAAENTLEVIQLSELQTQNLTKTLKLVNEFGQPVLAAAELAFTCGTTYGTAPNPITGTGGVFTVTPNSDCIPFSVNVHAQGYQDVQSYPIVADKDVYNIVMYATQTKDASIIVTVLDNQNAPVPGLDVSVQYQGVIVENNLTDNGGIVTFSVAAGDYTIVVSDPVQQLYTSQTDTLFVGSGETGTVTFHVSKNAANIISATVIDKKTNNPIGGATVKLKQGNVILQTIVTGTDGKANLPIADKTQSYQVSAFKEGYVPSQQTISGAATTVTFALEKATGSNTAKLTVHVHDQDNDPVADAKVVLYNADTGFLAPYEAALSDMNGNAKFSAVVSGNYKAFAYKATLTGFSNEQFFDITDPTTYDFTIALEVPDGTVSVHVTDKDGQPVPFAKVSVYNAFKNQLLGADLTDTNGT